MKFLKYFSLFLVIIMLAGSATPVFAQDYVFQVPEMAVVVSVNQDGSINIDYTLTFVNNANAHEIDIVDIGLPNYNYNLKSISAEVDGNPLKKITASDIVSPGISVYLQDYTIPPGGTGKVRVYIQNVKEVIYPATQQESEEYASLLFSPHWYEPQNAYGKTNYQMTLLLPTGVSENEGRYYIPENWPGTQEPESMIMDDGRIFYTWVSDQANLYTQYYFGASFPSRYLSTGAVVTEPYVPPSEQKPSGGTINLDNICPIIFCLGFAIFFGLIVYSAVIGAKKRKLKYLPPKIMIEGNGVKRGLTAVEAAVLMEQPMDKVFTMILFSALKKNASEVVTKDPLELKPADPIPADLYAYETDFVKSFNLKGNDRKKALQITMVNLIKSVTEKMKGFSRKESIEYYQEIMKRAWAQVEQAATPEVKAQVYEEVMDWTMLDKQYENKTEQTFSGPVLIPTPSWWWRYDPSIPRPVTSTIRPTAAPTSTSSTGSAPSMPTTVSLPTMPGSAFAASVVNSVSSFSSNVLGGLTGFSGGVTNVTNPPPPPSTYRSGSSGHSGGGGGHSCACACACAGCACACAGGGR